MLQRSGASRSVINNRYALLAPDGFVPSYVPGWEQTTCQIVIAPQMGAHFTQTLCTMEARGTGAGITNDNELLLYVWQGSLELLYRSASVGGAPQSATLQMGGYAYLPPGTGYTCTATTEATRVLIFERYYLPHDDDSVQVPMVLIGNEQHVAASPFLGDDGAMLKQLLPDKPEFDMAVNIFTFAPGATLPFVETHIMEHGVLILQGGGIYRLDNDWHPVQQGDVIWMAPYCPQWFVATGKTPARYIYYKDVNRHPMHF